MSYKVRGGSVPIILVFAAALVVMALWNSPEADAQSPSLADNFPGVFETVTGPEWATQPCARAISGGRTICTEAATGRTFSSGTGAVDGRWDPWPPTRAASPPPSTAASAAPPAEPAP